MRLKSRYLVVLPGARGHGQSDKPHHPMAFTPANLAADLAAVLDHAGIQKAYYWGYSQGGWSAFALARSCSGPDCRVCSAARLGAPHPGLSE